MQECNHKLGICVMATRCVTFVDLAIFLVVCCQLFVYIWEMDRTTDEELSTQNKGTKLHVDK